VVKDDWLSRGAFHHMYPAKISIVGKKKICGWVSNGTVMEMRCVGPKHCVEIILQGLIEFENRMNVDIKR
jgi:hypothetical protein